ncbi:hypothetical protein ASG67_12335 [Sphingomonas sp. Leaf339]|uniref:hypothetical protein n=1 Tax=Sphingomonas sp. Leaf339 TaxID=1736343 RepID=UPI0006F896F9|nr:hypothetical protein [Sphingomonas sp. Leaf339]KQU48125.1 hypothetical protein ASG67_12335 [Sphingomonas sp. Leaf339]
MKTIKGVTLLGLAGILSTAASAQNVVSPSKEERIELSEKQMKLLLSLTPEHFTQTTTTNDGDLDTIAVLDTSEGYKNKGRFTDPVKSDNFLRALIIKATGAVRYQVYQTVTYNSVFRDFRSVNFGTLAGPRSAELGTLKHEVINCAYGVCTYRDDVGFDVPDALMRDIANTYVSGASPLWGFKFNAQSGVNWEDCMTPAEAAGLLAAVAKYRSAHPIKN